MPDPSVMKEYVNHVLQCLGDNSLSRVEEAIGSKLLEAQNEAMRIEGDLGHLTQTIQQAQKRKEELVEKLTQVVHKSTGFAESLITLKFEDEIKEDAESKGNGSEDPSRKVLPAHSASLGKKKKRSRHSRSKAASARRN
jgi:uncharacterized coiled-coil DUF342 family protein